MRRPQGGYFPARDEDRRDRPLTIDTLKDHLAGNKRIGMYLFEPEDSEVRVSCGVFDLDSHDGETPWNEMVAWARSIRDHLASKNITAAWFRSGGGAGIHLWLTFSVPVDAAVLREFMQHTLTAVGLKDGAQGIAAGQVEIFPKQDRVKKSNYGNLVALPLSDHSVPLADDGSLLPKERAAEALQSLVPSPSEALPDTRHDRAQKRGRPKKAREFTEHRMEACHFVHHCQSNASTIGEPQWYALATNCVAVEGGETLFHRLSATDSARYDREEASSKLEHAADAPGPHTCQTIAGEGFPCPMMDSAGRCSIHNGTRPADFMEDVTTRIDRIRKSDVIAEEKHKQISDVVLKDLKSHGAFLKVDTTKRLIYFHGTERAVYDLESSEFAALCNDAYDINASTPTWRFLIAHLRAYCERKGASTSVHRLAAFRHGTLYINAGGNELFRLDGERIERLPNGTDEIMFENDDMESIDDHARHQAMDTAHGYGDEAVREHLVDALPNASDVDRTLYHAYIYSIYFESLLPTKPLILLNGPKGCGKTYVARALKKALFGSDGDVSTGFSKSESDAISAITNNYLLVADNVDGMVPWMADLLASVSTGTNISMRKLYADNVELRFTPRCFLMITSRDPVSLKRDDIADRLLVIDLESRPSEFRPESDLHKQIADSRTRIWSDLLRGLNHVVRFLRANELPQTSAHRLADWSRLATVIGSVLGIGDVEDALEELSTRRKDFVLQDNAVYEGIQMWVEQGKWKSEDGKEREVATGELFQEIKSIYFEQTFAPGNKGEFPIKSARAFGKELVNMRADLERYFEIEFREGRARKKYVRITPKSLSAVAA